MGQSTKKKRRRQNVYEGGQSNARKEMIMKKLRALKERRDNTRHSKQQKNAMDSFFGYINNTGRFKNVVDDEGKRHYEHVTAEMFLIKVALSQSRKYKNVKIREIKPTSWYSYFHKYEKLNSISRPNVSLINSSSTLTTTATTVNPISTTTTVNQGSNTSNRLDGFRVGLNAARAAMGDSPLEYNQFNTQQSI